MIKYKTIDYPDGQHHVRVDPNELDKYPNGYDLVHRIRNANELLELELIVDAMSEKSYPRTLTIPYLLAGRSDRPMVPGDAFALRVIANRINALNFRRVRILEPHSVISILLIDNSWTWTADHYLKDIACDPVLIIPDKGASPHRNRRLSALGTSDYLQIDKSRNPDTGEVSVTLPEDATKWSGRNLIVVDDICDGGASFIPIAKSLRPLAKSIHLAVTHGIFSKGTKDLSELFDTITCTDSYTQNPLPHTRLIRLNYDI